jgi:hypothetical protein
MAQHESQPEEGLLKPVAAGAQFAGSFVYSRAIVARGRPGDVNTHDKKPRTEASGKPEVDQPQAAPPAGGDDPELAQLIDRLAPTDPWLRLIDMLQEPTAPWPPTGTEVEAPETGSGKPPGAAPDGPAAEDDAALACGELDAAAAQQRLQTGQVEPPPAIAPAGPALGPAL